MLSPSGRAVAMSSSAVMVFVIPLLFSWWPTLKDASRCVSSEVAETSTIIDKTSATAAEWDALVVPRVLKLVNVTLPALSKGWANGLLALWTSCWAYELGFCINFLDTDRGVMIVFCAFGACIPLGFALGVAGTSSDCDTIKATLNTKRATDTSVENHAKLAAVESLLQNDNNGQGLGFVVAGRVMDRKTLKAIFIAMIGFLGTVLLMIIALRPTLSVPCAATAAVAACTDLSSDRGAAECGVGGRAGRVRASAAHLQLLQSHRRIAAVMCSS